MGERGREGGMERDGERGREGDREGGRGILCTAGKMCLSEPTTCVRA